MPIVQIRTEAGNWTEAAINRRDGGDWRVPPLTLGPGPDSASHLHLPEGAPSASLIGSGVSIAYAYVLQAGGLVVNGRFADGLRVLRHLDRISIGTAEIRYLEFAVRTVGNRSFLIGEKCASAGCGDGALQAADDYVSCPWCGRVYHASCWMATEKCSAQTRGCYPVRRVLLAALADRIKIEKMADMPESLRRCRAQCMEIRPEGGKLPAAPIGVGLAYLPCPNPDCRVAYHVPCLLRMRGPCPACDFDIPGMIDRRIEGTDREAFSR